MTIIERIQETAAKTPVALTGSVGSTLATTLESIAQIITPIGQISTGVLAVLILINWVNVNIIRKNKNK